MFRDIKAKAFLCLAFCIGLAGCHVPDDRTGVEPVARTVYEKLHDGDYAGLLAMGTDDIKTPEARAGIEHLHDLLPKGAPSKSTEIGWRKLTTTGHGEQIDFTHQYDYSGYGVSATTTFQRPIGGDWRLAGMNVRVATDQQLAANKFTLVGKSAAQYGFLAATVVSPILMLLAMVKVFRTPGLKRKWLWAPLALLGLCQFQMNWTDGSVATQLITVQLIGAGVTKAIGSFSSWNLAFSAPVGALLILTGIWANPRRARAPAEPRTTLVDS